MVVLRQLGAVCAKAFLSMFLLTAYRNAFGMSSENIVGYQAQDIRRGINTIVLPKQINSVDDSMTMEEVLSRFGTDSLLEGDEVLALDGIGNEEWGILLENEEGELRPFSSSGGDLSNWFLPKFGGDTYLKIRRFEDVSTRMAVSGEFDLDRPVNLPSYIPDVPLEKLQLPRDTAERLIVTATNKVSLGFQPIVCKKFDVILKDGRRILSIVDPSTRLVVDAKTQLPIRVATSDIIGFDEIKDSSVPDGEKVSRTEIKGISVNVGKQAHKYDVRRAFREGLIGAVWDDENPKRSVLCWVLVSGVVTLCGKIWELFLARSFKVISNIVQWILGSAFRRFLLYVREFCAGCIRTKRRALSAMFKRGK